MRKLFVWSLLFSVLFIVGLYVSIKVNLLIVHSGSLSYRVMILVKDSSYKKGDYATIEHHRPRYLEEDLRLTKKVVGLPGDRIRIVKNKIYVNNHLIGDLRRVNRNGQKLTPLQQPFIPEGYVFLQGDHAGSYDSRYQEFGLVRKEHIVGRTWPLF